MNKGILSSLLNTEHLERALQWALNYLTFFLSYQCLCCYNSWLAGVPFPETFHQFRDPLQDGDINCYRTA